MWRRASVAAVGLLALASSAAPAGLIPSTASEHTVQTVHGPLAYRVSWDEAPLGPPGTPTAAASTLSFVRDGTSQPSARPVLFAWGGGPGGQSMGFAFGPLGPRHPSADGHGFDDSPGTVLDAVDLVFIDAVGAGFSRALTPGGGKPYWSVDGDAGAFEAVIRSWLKLHGRECSPVYLLGESYGGFRMGKLLPRLAGVDIRGVVLVSPGLNLSRARGDLSAISADPDWRGGIDNDQAFIDNLPSEAVAAVRQGRVSAAGRSVPVIFEEAARFAQGQYAAALQQGDTLPASDRQAVAQRLAALVGLLPSQIEAQDLRVQSQYFLDHLVPGRVVGRLDSRVTGPPPKASEPGRIAAANDPSLGGMGWRQLTSEPVARYLKQEVGVKTELPYVTVDLDVNEGWVWNSGSPTLESNIVGLDVGPDISDFLRKRPDARLLLLSGYYDLAIPLAAQVGELAHLRLPSGRVTERRYEVGHEIGQDPTVRDDVAADVRAFVTGG